MTTFPFAEYGGLRRAQDMRLDDVRMRFWRAKAPCEHRISEPGRAIFVFVRKGDLILTLDKSTVRPMAAPTGTAAGFEGGRAHRWVSGSMKTGAEVELVVGSIPRQMAVLQRLTNGLIIVPADADPDAHILNRAVELMVSEIDSKNSVDDADDFIVRRCAEILLMQLVRYARRRISKASAAPAGLAHDEQLLRAMSAYFANPRRRWTVKALGDAAGLGRSVLTERFRKVFNSAPLQTLTRLRLEHAVTLLRQSKVPLLEIAFTVGYGSEAALVRAFHRQYGKPPGQFRAECQAASPLRSPSRKRR